MGTELKTKVNTKIDADIKLSNLIDDKSKNEIASSLQKFVGKENSDRFIKQVDYYNKNIEGESLVKDGYEQLSMVKKEYSVDKIIENWKKKNPVFNGFNCRLTTYSLLNDIVIVDAKAPVDFSLLFMDHEAIQDAKESSFVFKEEDVKKFDALFSAVKQKKI